MKHKLNDRVVDACLGAGEVKELIESSLQRGMVVGYMVLFDKTPDVRYNMGQNPTMVFPSALKVETDKVNE
jgi:hypothetical protein